MVPLVLSALFQFSVYCGTKMKSGTFPFLMFFFVRESPSEKSTHFADGCGCSDSYGLCYETIPTQANERGGWIRALDPGAVCNSTMQGG